MLTNIKSIIVAAVALTVAAAASARPEPAFIYESLLNTYFDEESGLISFTEYDVAFAPEPPFKAAVAVVNSDNKVVQSFPFFEDYRYREGVFARAQVKGPADVKLTEPGIYNIVMLVDGKPVSRLAVVLEKTSEGDDPFDPVEKYQFYGLWQVYGYLTFDENDEMTYPEFNLWVGMRDLPEGAKKDMFTATLKRNGEVIGHSKHTQGYISNEHYKRTDIRIFEPHEKKNSPYAKFVPLEEWTKDGDYQLDITRQSDGELIRRFVFTSKDGEIVNLPNCDLKHEPHIDYIPPRVQTKGSNMLAFEEAVWVRSEMPKQTTPANQE